MSGPAWSSERRRRQHFAAHRRRLNVRTLEEYDASALEAIRVGTYFGLIDSDTGAPRVGYYDRWTERLTALSEDESTIFSHFRCPERYVADLLGSTYS